MSQRLSDYLRELRSLAPEKPLVPELKGNRQEQDKKIKEDQDLNAGAILQATVEAGEGEATPATEDLVYVQYSVRNSDEDAVVASTRGEEGGAGHAFAFRLEKGRRAPRGLELAIAGMTRMQRVAVKVRPDYGYSHPDCTMAQPAGLRKDRFITFDVQLVNWYPAATVRHLGNDGDYYKRTLVEGGSWESPRPPFEVTLHITACTPAFNGVQMSGVRYYSSEREGATGQPLVLQLGAGMLPLGVEEALGHMSRGETAVYVIPADQMTHPPPPTPALGTPPAAAGATPVKSVCVMPAAPVDALQVEVQIQLIALVQVRDMTGSGEVMKRRLRDGEGEFPIDCPLNDTTVRLHYRARPVRAGIPGAWVFDSRGPAVAGAASGTDGAAPSTPAPVEFDTGCGEAPEGLEMCAKLMVPGELAAVTCAPRYAYVERDDSPAGISGRDDTVEFEVELFGFDKEGHWQSMTMAERFVLAERTKVKANELYRQRKYMFAKARYDRLSRLLESTRDFEDDADIHRVEAFKVAVAGNMAACFLAMADYAKAIDWCTKALRMDGVDGAKLMLRRGRAHSLNGDFEKAEEDLTVARELEQHAAAAAATAVPAEQETPAGGGDASIAVVAALGGGAVGAAARLAAVDAELTANRQREKHATTKQKQQFRNFFDRT